MTLAVEGVGIAVGDPPRWLVRGLTLSLPPGLCAVVGPNGSGKSSLLRVLAALQEPTEGTVTLDDQSLAGLDRRARARRLAYLPQSTPLSHDLTVFELTMLGRLPYLPRLGAPSRDDRDLARAALDDVELSDLADRRLSTLSGGERQRAMLARMLATAADVLLLDEPTTALDVRHRLDVLALCRRLGSSGRTLVVALHDLALARRFADRAVCLTRDPDGLVYEGAAPSILHPDVLSDVFGVPMALREDDLVLDRVAFGPNRAM